MYNVDLVFDAFRQFSNTIEKTKLCSRCMLLLIIFYFFGEEESFSNH